MIKNLVLRGLPSLTLTVLPLFSAAPASHSAPAPTHVAKAAGPAGGRAPLPLFDAIDQLPVAAEHREGYTRDPYKHWNSGLNSGDDCDTRKEVILTEAVTPPQVAAGCTLTGGTTLQPPSGATMLRVGRHPAALCAGTSQLVPGRAG